MHYRYTYYDKHCRWCGKAYQAAKPHDRDGFDTKTCKQAHYRAYKKYVTAIGSNQARAQAKPVTLGRTRKK